MNTVSILFNSDVIVNFVKSFILIQFKKLIASNFVIFLGEQKGRQSPTHTAFWRDVIRIDTQCAPGFVLGSVLATSLQEYLSIV